MEILFKVPTIKINVACVFVLQQLPQHIHRAVHSFFRIFFNYQCWTKVNKRDLFRRAEKLMWDVEYFWTVTNRKRTHLTKHRCYKTVKIVFSLFYHYTLPTITINFSVNTRKTLQEMFNNPLKVYIVLKFFPFLAYK